MTDNLQCYIDPFNNTDNTSQLLPVCTYDDERTHLFTEFILRMNTWIYVLALSKGLANFIKWSHIIRNDIHETLIIFMMISYLRTMGISVDLKTFITEMLYGLIVILFFNIVFMLVVDPKNSTEVVFILTILLLTF
tara:strand:+ start:166 stop:573 length:408 start_codon:yes stop_codon:yes gene_type:complete